MYGCLGTKVFVVDTTELQDPLGSSNQTVLQSRLFEFVWDIVNGEFTLMTVHNRAHGRLSSARTCLSSSKPACAIDNFLQQLNVPEFLVPFQNRSRKAIHSE